MASIPQSVRSWSDGEKSPAHGTAARSSGATPQSHNATTAWRHSSNCHATVAARWTKFNQNRAPLGFCVLGFLHACFHLPGRLVVQPLLLCGGALRRTRTYRDGRTGRRAPGLPEHRPRQRSGPAAGDGPGRATDPLAGRGGQRPVRARLPGDPLRQPRRRPVGLERAGAQFAADLRSGALSPRPAGQRALYPHRHGRRCPASARRAGYPPGPCARRQHGRDDRPAHRRHGAAAPAQPDPGDDQLRRRRPAGTQRVAAAPAGAARGGQPRAGGRAAGRPAGGAGQPGSAR